MKEFNNYQDLHTYGGNWKGLINKEVIYTKKIEREAKTEHEGYILDKIIMSLNNDSNNITTGYLILDKETEKIESVQHWRIKKVKI